MPMYFLVTSDNSNRAQLAIMWPDHIISMTCTDRAEQQRQTCKLTPAKTPAYTPTATHSGSPIRTQHAYTHAVMHVRTRQHTELMMACQGSRETVGRAAFGAAITPCDTHRSFNHLVLQWVRKQGKGSRLQSWPPLLSQIYDPLSNFSIYSVV